MEEDTRDKAAYRCPACGRLTYRRELGPQIVFEHADTGSVLCKESRPR